MTFDMRNVCHKHLLIFLTLCFTGVGSLLHAQSAVEELYRDAMDAYYMGDHGKYLEKFISIQQELPESPVVWAHLTRAWSLNENADSAARYFIQRNKLILDPAFNAHDDLQFLRSSAYWIGMEEMIARLAENVGHADTAFQLSSLVRHPEALAFNPLDSSWLIGDVRQGFITRYIKGVEEELVPEGDQGLGAVMAIGVDPNEGHFFVANVRIPEWEKYTPGGSERSSIHVYHLKDGLFIHKIDHFDAGNDHLFGDILVYKDGTAFISDSYQPLIFRLDNQIGLREHIRSEHLSSPQGMAIHSDSAILYVADYSKGIVAFDLFTGEFLGRTLESPEHSLKGIDGLYWHDGALIAIQNGSVPKRILRLELRADGRQVIHSSAVLNAHPALDEPTQGVILNDELYFIANSPWLYYEERRELQLPTSYRPLILKCRLD